MEVQLTTTPGLDGVETIDLRVTASKAERDRITWLADQLRDLAGVTRVGDAEVFDQSAYIMLTAERKALLCDVADLIRLMVGKNDQAAKT